MNDELINKMVDRFLCWKLPKDFAPDGGVSFVPIAADGFDRPGFWPVGTHLFTADQAKGMVMHMLGITVQGEVP